jgi:hypothetical protein
MLPSTGNGIPPFFNERKSRITWKRPHLRRKHVQTAHIKSRSPNPLVTSLLICSASIDRKWTSPFFNERKSRITWKRPHLRRIHVQTAHIKSRSPNPLVTSLLICSASIDRKWTSPILKRTKIANNFETIGIKEKTCTDN